MSKIKIRQLNDDDVSGYRYIRLEMLKNHPEAYADSYNNTRKKNDDFFLYRINNGAIFAAFDNNEIIATTGFFMQPHDNAKHKAMIWGVYVKPEYRGQGLSYDLLVEAIKNLPDTAKLVQLCVVEGNEAAQSTYEKAGFKIWGIEERAICVDGRYYDEKHMVKFLGR